MHDKVTSGTYIPGRNHNQRIDLGGGATRFRKRIAGGGYDAKRRFNNLLLWDNLIEGHQSIRSPKILRSDSEAMELDFEWIEAAQPVHQLLHNEDGKRCSLLHSAILVVAEIHSIPGPWAGVARNPATRGASVLRGIDVDEYARASGGELELLSLFHSDNALFEAANRLIAVRNGDSGREVLSHGDLRADQFVLAAGGEIWVVDLEELCTAPPEFDLAHLYASLVFMSVYDVCTVEQPDETENERLDDLYLEEASVAIERGIDEISSLSQTYRSLTGAVLDNDLLTAELGWCLIERIISRAKLTAKVSAIDKAIAGIGRQIMVDPAAVSKVIEGDSLANSPAADGGSDA